MGGVKLVTNKYASGSTINEGSEDLWGVAKLSINDKRLGGLQANLQRSVEVVGGTDQGSDIEGNGLRVLIHTEVGGAKPGEAQDEGGRGMQTGHKQPKILLLTIGR
ncbi:hypothetical protein C0993_001661, partial [Termitomyces sp. T159_Od127]